LLPYAEGNNDHQVLKNKRVIVTGKSVTSDELVTTWDSALVSSRTEGGRERESGVMGG